VEQIGDRRDVAAFVGTVGAGFRLADAGGGDRLPVFARAAGRPTAISQDLGFGEVSGFHFYDALGAEHLNGEAAGVAAGITARGKVTGRAAGEGVGCAEIVAREWAEAFRAVHDVGFRD